MGTGASESTRKLSKLKIVLGILLALPLTGGATFALYVSDYHHADAVAQAFWVS